MKSFEEIRERELYLLNFKKNNWENDPRGLDDYWVKKVLDNIDVIEDNFDEYLKETIAFYAISEGETLKNSNIDFFGTYNGGYFNIQKDDTVAQRFDLENSIRQGIGNLTADDFAQSIYESYGYTEKLPTAKDIEKLEEARKSIDFNDPNYALKIAQIDKELMLARKHRGDGINQTFNSFIPEAQILEIDQVQSHSR